MRKLTTMVALTIITSSALTGCGTTSNPEEKSVKSVASSSSETAASSQVKEGAEKLLSLTSEFRKNLDAGDAGKIKDLGSKLKETWSAFEEQVRPDYPAQYTSVEQYLEPLIAGSSKSPYDKEVLSKLNDSLILAINDLLNAVTNHEIAKKADNPQLQAAIDEYRKYVVQQSQSLVDETTSFVKAIHEGDMEQAKRLYGSSRVFYERIEPIAESFGDLDAKIDARENDVEKEEWTGFHEIEKALWMDHSLKGQDKYANQLLEDVKALHQKLETVSLKPAQVISGAVELLNEAGTSKVTGEEERYSHIDLVDLYANVEGSKAAYNTFKTIIEQKDPELVKKIDERFAVLDKTLISFRQGDSFVSYTNLKQEDTKNIGQEIDSTAESLSQAAKIL
ncbi:putative iron uptake system component EfeM [Effusibacillus dendaii]|uniref:Putative iron uptake system component EfeM n=1 Tax=Effusibacillus dendaii TaxID=2743772 RepID=A0A7I8D6C3_9BACL|nr:putative iron uptake system component EfeM [Effusibacillus dendaii]